MRIVYLTDSQLPSFQANGVHVMRMADALVDSGHEVLVVARPGRPDPDVDLRTYYGVRNSIIPQLVPDIGPPILRTFLRRWRTRRLVRSERRIDLIYGRSANLLYACRNLKTPLVYEMHAISPPGRLRRTEHALLTSVNLRRLVVISDQLADDVRSTFQPHGIEIVVARDAADPPSESTSTFPLAGVVPGPAVGYVGSFYPGRGLATIEVMATALPHIEFHLAGSDDPLTWARLGNVHTYGRLYPSDVSSFYLALDIALAPFQRSVSVAGGGDTSRWMSPLKIFEYMAHGLAIVASDVPAIREILDDRTAVLVDPEDPTAWVDAVRALSEDDDLRLGLQRRARAQYERAHTWTGRAEQILDGVRA